MANYTQIYLHVVFAVSGRACVTSSARRKELQKYITGIIRRQGQKLIAIYCMPDHTHILLGLKPNIAPSDLIGDIKTGSTNHINEQKWIGGRFFWQEGYGAFPFPFKSGLCGHLYSEPKDASSPKVVPAGIF